MTRLAPVALTLALLLALEPAAWARGSRPTRSTSGMDRREMALVLRALDDDADLIDEMLATDKGLRELADAYLPAYRARMAGGRALLALGVIGMGLGAIVGASLYLAGGSYRRPGIGVMGGMIGGGLALFVPGVALMATPSGAERDMRTYWQDHRAGFLRPESRQGPRLRLAPGWSVPPAVAFPALSMAF